MKLKITLISSFILLIVLSILYDNLYTISMISGSYVYNFPAVIADGPGQGDTLILKENGDFENGTWGKGTYHISGSKLSLTYEYEFGKAGFETSIYRPLFWGKPRIGVVKDLDYYYKKIN